jgi:ATP-binding cassette subfamily C (CFTR/MRP) protein 10
MLQVTHDSLQPHNNTNSSLFIFEVVTDSSDGSNISYYLTVYALFAGLNSVFTLFRAFLFAYGGIHAATDVHKKLLKTIMKVSNIIGWKLVKLNLLYSQHQTELKIEI